MRDWAIRGYHLLPLWARSAAVNLRARHLRRWRYGPETERLAEEAREREHWSVERWRSWQEERLAYVLHRAATTVPYYRDQWYARRRRGDRASPEILANWPILEKETLRTQPRRFVADDRATWALQRDHTSGTTGTPLTVWRSRGVTRALFALALTRIRRWNGVSLGDAWAMFGGRLVVPASQERLPFWMWNAALRQLYMSTVHLAPRFAPAYRDALRRYGVAYLQGHASALYTLAQEIECLEPAPLDLRVVITSAEPLAETYRATLERVFRCPARETYGCAEGVVAASECEAGALHLWPEVGWLEVVGADGPVPTETSGDLVCTSLLTTDMLLVRYRLGDRAKLKADWPACACGRTLPRIAAIEGRSSDRLVTPDGRLVYWLNPVFYGLPLREAQIVQDSPDAIRVVFVPEGGFSASHAGIVVDRLWHRLGKVRVSLERVPEIPRGPDGKFRPVISRVTPDPLLPRRGAPTSR